MDSISESQRAELKLTESESCIRLTLAIYTPHQKEYFITRGKIWKENKAPVGLSILIQII